LQFFLRQHNKIEAKAWAVLQNRIALTFVLTPASRLLRKSMGDFYGFDQAVTRRHCDNGDRPASGA